MWEILWATVRGFSGQQYGDSLGNMRGVLWATVRKIHWFVAYQLSDLSPPLSRIDLGCVSTGCVEAMLLERAWKLKQLKEELNPERNIVVSLYYTSENELCVSGKRFGSDHCFFSREYSGQPHLVKSSLNCLVFVGRISLCYRH